MLDELIDYSKKTGQPVRLINEIRICNGEATPSWRVCIPGRNLLIEAGSEDELMSELKNHLLP